MFLLAKDQTRCKQALEKLRAVLQETVSCGPVHLIKIEDYFLGWLSCRATDNLHAYTDGYVIGKLGFAEQTAQDPIHHNEPMPASVHPLLMCVKLIRRSDRLIIEPCNMTTVFHAGSSVSDMQLLLADMHGFRPGQQGVAVFSVVGWLPGNLTLFDEVKRIPYLHAYDLERQTDFSCKSFTYRENDDEALIERLVESVPQGVDNVLGISGGYDSRNALGILLRAGADFSLVHASSEEQDVVEALARQVGVPVTIVPVEGMAPSLPARAFTVMTDAQLYAAGAQSHRLREFMRWDAVFHRAQFSTLIFKNPAGAAWKVPAPRSLLYKNLIDQTLLNRSLTPIIRGITFDRRERIQAYLLEELDYINHYYDFPGRKEAAAWFHSLNRGVRWYQANASDMAYYTYPVLIGSEQQALELGITSNLWDNFGYERVRRINRRLLPQVTAPYYDGQPAERAAGIAQALHKVTTEYGGKLMTWLKGKKRHKQTSDPRGVDEEQLPTSSPAGFASYYTAPDVATLVRDPSVRTVVKRTAVTVHCALEYLAMSVPTAVATGDGPAPSRKSVV